MSYTINLTTHDAQNVQFECNADEDVISAAERQQILLPQQCRNGVCGFCTAAHLSGEYQLRDYNEAALSAEQRAQRQTLLCRTYPQSDLQIATDYDYAAIRFGHAPEAQMTVVEKSRVNHNVLFLAVQQADNLDNLLSANLLAGQYMHLMPLDKSIKRAYSLASPANWEGRLEFFIRLWENGQFSQHLQQLNVGDNLLVRGAQGEFVLQENGLKPRWFIAGGTGISPMLAMLRQMAEFAEPHPARLFFGLRHEADIFALEQLESLKQQLPNFSYQICLSRPSPAWKDKTQSIIAAVAEALDESKATPDIYICGSNRLVEGVLQVAKTYGIASDKLQFERFG